MEHQLSVKDAYTAMLVYLEALQKRTNSDDLAEFLGSMDFMDDGGTMDPAAWRDWIDAVAQVTEGHKSE